MGRPRCSTSPTARHSSPFEAIKTVTVGNLSQVLDHRITRSLGRTVHVLHFLEVVSCAWDHLGRLTALVSLALRCTASEDCTWSSTRIHRRTSKGERGSGMKATLAERATLWQ